MESIHQTDRQTDRRFRLRLPKKKRSQETIPILSKFAGFFYRSIDPIDRFPIETRSKPAISSVVPDRFDSTRSVRVRFAFDSVSISISIRSDARIDRWFLSIERPPGCGSTDGATVQANRRSVGRFAFVIHIIGWIHRPHRPVSGDADARTRGRDRPVRFVERFVERFD